MPSRRQFLGVAGRVLCGAPIASSLSPNLWAAAKDRPSGTAAAGPLRVHADNPRYFTDGSGKAIYLTGSHTWPNLVDMGPSDPPPRFDFDAYLDFLVRHDHNFIRLWTWELTSWNTKANREEKSEVHVCTPQPYARTGPGKALDGKPKFDLTKYDPEYFDRLRKRVAAARDRAIYVSIMLFEGWGVQFVENALRSHPYHAQNNINGLDGDRNGDGSGVEIHELVEPKVTGIQEAYVRKVVDTVNDLDNVLFEVSNENHPASTPWQYHIIRYVKDYERTKPKQHPVGMTFQYKAGSNQALFDSPADWVSPNSEGGYRDNPPAADGRKVVLSDTDHLWGIGGNQAWVWKTFLRGLNPLFMDPYDRRVLSRGSEDQWEVVRRSMGVTLRVARKLNLAAMRPQPDRASTGYCLASAPKSSAEYVVYLPEGGEASVDLSDARGALRVEWLRPSDGKFQPAGTVEAGRRQKFVAPIKGDAVLWLKAE